MSRVGRSCQNGRFGGGAEWGFVIGWVDYHIQSLINSPTVMLSRLAIRNFKRFAPLLLSFRHVPFFPLCSISRIKKSQPGTQSAEDSIFLQQEDESGEWATNYYEAVHNYPFHSIPLGVIRNPKHFNIPQEDLHTLIAFKAIKARGEDVKLAAAILLPGRENYEDFGDNDSGRLLFSEYFAPKCGKLVNDLNAGTGTLEERTALLQILINMQPDEKYLPKATIKQLDLRAMANHDETGVLISHAVHLLIRNQLEYTHLLQLVNSKLQDKATPISIRSKIAKAIISVYRFDDYFSQKMMDLSLQALAANMDATHNYQLLFIIRHIYTYSSGRKFAEELQKYLIRKHIDQHNIDFHIPLVLKTIKYCSKQGVSTRQLVEFITNNMKRFQVIFDKKRVAKGLFFSLLFEKSNKDISPQMVVHLKTYFLDTLANFVRSEQTEESELMRFNKLLVKYFEYFSEKEQEYLRKEYFEKMIPYYSQSNQVLFYSLLVYFRTKAPQGEQVDPSKQQTLKKYIQLFFKRCCSKGKSQQMLVQNHINSVIEMMYQVLRHDITFNKYQLPLICRYDFSQKDSLSPECVNYFFYYLLKNQHENKEAVRQALTSVQPLLETFIRKHKIYSLKTFLSIIDLCDRVNFQHNFFYKILENCLLDFLVKNPRFVLMQKDLKFINQKFIKRGYGSPKLKQMIVTTLQKPKDWQSNRRDYVQSQMKYQQSIQKKRRESRSKPRN